MDIVLNLDSMDEENLVAKPIDDQIGRAQNCIMGTGLRNVSQVRL